ncbi:hypothetical protein [Jannaschia sp. LMIT008]|uniref:hypothetical protein n=1 Tax=Jannaschia maritima TaxID=3032585 RepID=UPI0028120BC8|nr:hypothetical protein [Jannaschia sp. LMIT008]
MPEIVLPAEAVPRAPLVDLVRTDPSSDDLSFEKLEAPNPGGVDPRGYPRPTRYVVPEPEDSWTLGGLPEIEPLGPYVAPLPKIALTNLEDAFKEATGLLAPIIDDDELGIAVPNEVPSSPYDDVGADRLDFAEEATVPAYEGTVAPETAASNDTDAGGTTRDETGVHLARGAETSIATEASLGVGASEVDRIVARRRLLVEGQAVSRLDWIAAGLASLPNFERPDEE